MLALIIVESTRVDNIVQFMFALQKRYMYLFYTMHSLYLPSKTVKAIYFVQACVPEMQFTFKN